MGVTRCQTKNNFYVSSIDLKFGCTPKILCEHYKTINVGFYTGSSDKFAFEWKKKFEFLSTRRIVKNIAKFCVYKYIFVCR